MAAAVSIRDVAARAGVSVGTVSNVLNRTDAVAAGTRARVLQAIEELGFVRNESARQLSAGGSRVLGLLVPDIANPYFTDIARGVEDVASRSGLSVILCNTDSNLDKQRRYLAVLLEERVRAILVSPAGGLCEPLDLARRRGIPVVLLDQRGDGDQCSVSIDHRAAGRLAAAHLIEEGHTRVGFISSDTALWQTTERFRGAREVLAAAGCPDAAMFEVHSLSVAGGRKAAEQVASRSPEGRPTAVFCANDLVAMGLLQECARAAIRVPEDLAIVGYDDIEFASAGPLPLSSVRQPRYDIGSRATELALDEVFGTSHHHQQVVLPAQLEVRASSSGRPGRVADSRPG